MKRRTLPALLAPAKLRIRSGSTARQNPEVSPVLGLLKPPHRWECSALLAWATTIGISPKLLVRARGGNYPYNVSLLTAQHCYPAAVGRFLASSLNLPKSLSFDSEEFQKDFLTLKRNQWQNSSVRLPRLIPLGGPWGRCSQILTG